MPDDQTTEDEFEPGSGWNRSDLDVLNHEVAHAQVADFMSVKILEVRIDNPLNWLTRGPDSRGCCITEKIVGEDRWKDLCISLAPLIVENRAPKSIPSLDTAEPGDEMNIAIICYELEISSERYANLLSFTEAILEYSPSREKGTALSRELLDHGALPGHEVERIFREAEAQGKGKAKVSDDGQ